MAWEFVWNQSARAEKTAFGSNDHLVDALPPSPSAIAVEAALVLHPPVAVTLVFSDNGCIPPR